VEEEAVTWEYLAVLGSILLFPLVLSGDRNLGLYRHRRALLLTIVLVSVPYWVWDIAAISRGHWSFNPAYILGLRLADMPLEEWLFFPVLAFVSIFTWESALYFQRRRK
jgi:lycopene cyclase domain-containing protein